MDDAISLLVIALIIIFLLPTFFSYSAGSKANMLLREIEELKKTIREINFNVKEIKNRPVAAPEIQTAKPEPENEKIKEEPVAEVNPVIEPIPEPEPEVKPEEIITEEIGETILEEILPVEPDAEDIPEPVIDEPVVEIPVPEEPVVFAHAAVPSPAPPPRPAFQPKRKTDFEQFIGEKLISLVGIAILVLGIFFTVKWAIDRHLITDAGKILIGLASGTILIGVAHKLSKNYRAFSSILAGGGIAVLYFSIYQAYQSYHLLPQTGAFAAMFVITILAVVLSIIYDKKELAVIALIGGFATPFFVSNGSGNYQVLFSYLLILNIGMFVLAIFKKWNLLNIIGYVLTIIIFSAWALNMYDIKQGHNAGGFLFASLFYIVFFATNIIYNVRNNEKFAAIEISMLLSNSFLYLGAGLFFLHSIHHGDYQGMFVIGLAVFNFIFAFWFYKKRQVDKNLIYLLIALVLTFISLAGPIQLHGNYITLFWACETVILYWLGVKSGIPIIKNASLALVVLTLGSLAGDWINNYYSVQVNKLPLIFNKAFITGLVVIAAFYVKLHWVKKDDSDSLLWGGLSRKVYIGFFEVIWILVVYFVGIQEVKYQSFTITRLSEFRDISLWVYHCAFIAVLFWLMLRKANVMKQNAIAGFSALTIILFPIANVSITGLRQMYLFDSTVTYLYHLHYLAPAFALCILVLLIKFVQKNHTESDSAYRFAAWFITIAGCYILSAEIIHIWISGAHQPGFDSSLARQKAIKVGWPILWSIISLSLMWIGMKNRIKHLRIISLTLFTVTIVKLFVNDISNVSQGGKIAAFIILGVILLIVSFMYQKIKGLFTDDTTDNSTI